MQLAIGTVVDPGSLGPTSQPAFLDADGLVRHAVCVGMTGSGKTGMCVALLEELALAKVPLIIIDPKGDMANLGLAFREHSAGEFLPWVDPAAAQREGLTVDQLAERTSKRWRDALESEGVSERARAWVNTVDVTVYTPGSTSGVSVDLLGTMLQCPTGLADDEEGLADLIAGTVSSLLALVGVEADPVTDPTHLVLSRVVEDSWRGGTDLALDALILRLIDPPFAKVGVFPLETFYPRADRMKLAMQLNGLVASPSFAPWAQGVPLDPQRFLTGERTPVSVFSLAHLDEARRMFFITQLLNRIVAWSRRQSGTSGLRALVYFDEVFGYLPPHPRNPPTKKPVLTLMKQARAVGIGTMLVTQNPVDVDYSALSNAGLWMIGRLQTPQDRAKVVEGLAGAGVSVDAAQVDAWLSQLPARTFVVRESTQPAPKLIRSRQTITYLRGPLTRAEIERLRAKPAPAPQAPQVVSRVPSGFLDTPPPAPAGYSYRYLRPDLAFSARFRDFVEPHARPNPGDGSILWEPAIYARLRLSFVQGREFGLHRDEFRLFFPVDAAPLEPAFEAGDLVGAPGGKGKFAPLPEHVDEARELKALEKRVVEDVFRGETERMFRHVALKLDGRAGETEEQFRVRVDAAVDERADAEIAKLKEKVDRELKRIAEKRDRLARERDRLTQDAAARKANEVVSVGASLFGMFFGRRAVTSSVTSAMSKRTATNAVEARADAAAQDLDALQREEYELANRTEDEIAAIRAKWDPARTAFETIEVRLARNGVTLDEFGIVWIPVSRPL